MATCRGQHEQHDFTLAPQALGTYLFRASLKKKGKTRKAMSGPLTVVVVPTPAPGPRQEHYSRHEYLRVGSNTQVSFNGTLTGLPAGTQVTVESAVAPTHLGACGPPSRQSRVSQLRAGCTFRQRHQVLPIVIDASTQGAPHVNFRAVVGGTALESAVKAYLVNTTFSGQLTQFQKTAKLFSTHQSWFFITIRSGTSLLETDSSGVRRRGGIC